MPSFLAIAAGPSSPDSRLISPASMLIGRPLYFPAAFALAMPSLPLSESATHYATMASSSSGPLFRGEPTRRSIGHKRSSPSGAGRNSAAQSPSASPSHVGQSCWSRITGIRSCSSDISAFGVVVMMVKVRITVSSDQRKLFALCRPRPPSTRRTRPLGRNSVAVTARRGTEAADRLPRRYFVAIVIRYVLHRRT